MITSVEDFLRYFRGIHERSARDVTALPVAAAGWRPERGVGEGGWSIDELVAHIAELRLFFVSAYRGEGWRTAPPHPVVRQDWRPALDDSARAVAERLSGTPEAWLTRRVRTLDGDGEVAGWRVLMMLVEHEVHHRSQIDTYAGLNGWGPPQIFERTFEQVLDAQERRGTDQASSRA